MSTPAVEEFLKEQAVIMFRLEHERLKKEGFAVAYTFIELSSDETLGLEEVTPLAEGAGKSFSTSTILEKGDYKITLSALKKIGANCSIEKASDYSEEYLQKIYLETSLKDAAATAAVNEALDKVLGGKKDKK